MEYQAAGTATTVASPVTRTLPFADVTSALFNGTVLDGRFSIETYAVDGDGNSVPLEGKVGAKSGFHFIVTRP